MRTLPDLENLICNLYDIKSLNDLQKNTIKSDAKRLIIIAPTGSGKTIAFVSVLLKSLSERNKNKIRIILAPSRELVLQIERVVKKLTPGFKTIAMYGGHSMLDETNSLNPLPTFIVATPGRLLDHLQRQTFKPTAVEAFVVDEYDKLLELGFEGEMKKIFSRIPSPNKIILTSATKAATYPSYLDLFNPEIIEDTNSTNPKQRMQITEVVSTTDDKIETLINLLRGYCSNNQSIVFVNHRESAERVAQLLKKNNIPVALYHGALDQQQREISIDTFTNGSSNVLVSTDLASRGIDIPDIENIIHYHLPTNEQTWIHRNGRTARVDKNGKIYVITNEKDSVAEYISFDNKLYPKESPQFVNQIPELISLYINAGKKEKVSKGDIAGFISASQLIPSNSIGKIIIHDHYSIVAIPNKNTNEIIQKLNSLKLKGKKVRVSEINRMFRQQRFRCQHVYIFRSTR